MADTADVPEVARQDPNGGAIDCKQVWFGGDHCALFSLLNETIFHRVNFANRAGPLFFGVDPRPTNRRGASQALLLCNIIKSQHKNVNVRETAPALDASHPNGIFLPVYNIRKSRRLLVPTVGLRTGPTEQVFATLVVAAVSMRLPPASIRCVALYCLGEERER